MANPHTTLHSAADVVAAAYRNNGLVTRMAADLGVTPPTIYSYRAKWKTVDDAIEEARRGLVDKAEEGLAAAIEAQDFRAIAFVLSRLGKDRGYVERTEVAALMGGDVSIERTVVDAPVLELEEGN